MVTVFVMMIKIWRLIMMMQRWKKTLQSGFPRFRGYDSKSCLDIVRSHEQRPILGLRDERRPMKIREKLTFDDVLLQPARSVILPADTNVKTG